MTTPASPACPYCATALLAKRIDPQTCPICRKLVCPALSQRDTNAVEAWVPADLGEYSLEVQVGRGGMGYVFRGRRKADNVPVAIKFPRLQAQSDGENWARFEREVESLKGVRHPHVVTYLSHGVVAGRPYCAMEWVEGLTLAHVLEDRRKVNNLPEFEFVMPRFQQLCEALQALHDRGLVHRDIKPSNILLTPDGGVKLIDLGIARAIGDDEETITEAGGVVGSLSYLAPEQFRGEGNVDHRADLYSLGAVIYEWLTGIVPRGYVRPLSALNATVPVWFDRVVLRMMENRPEDRPESVKAINDLIESSRCEVTQKPDPSPLTIQSILLAVGSALLMASFLGGLCFAVGRWLNVAYTFWLAIAGAVMGVASRETSRQHAAATGVSCAETSAQAAAGLLIGVIAALVLLPLIIVAWWITGGLCAQAFPMSVEPQGWWLPVALATGVLLGALAGVAVEYTSVVKKLSDSIRVGKAMRIAFSEEVFLSAMLRDAAIGACIGGTGCLILGLIHVLGGHCGYLSGTLVVIGVSGLVGMEIFAWKFANQDRGDRRERYVPSMPPFLAALVIIGIGIIYARWYATQGEPIVIDPPQSFVGHTDFIWTLAISRDGKYAVTSAFDKTLNLWRVADRQLIRSFSGHTGLTTCLDISPDNDRLLSGGENGMLQLWDMNGGNLIREWKARPARVSCAVFTPDGRQVLSGGGTGEFEEEKDKTVGDVLIWNVTSGKEVGRLRGHSGAVAALAISSNGRRVLSGGVDKTVRLWNLESMCEERLLRGHTESVLCVALSADGNHAVSGSYDRTVRLWDVKDAKERCCWIGHEDAVHNLDLSSDGTRILSGGLDMTVRLWKVGHENELHRLKGHFARFLPDGRSAIFARWDQVFRVFEGAKCVREYSWQLTNHQIHKLWVSPDGRHVTAATQPGIISLFNDSYSLVNWTINWERLLLPIPSRMPHTITALSFSKDGRYALTGERSDKKREHPQDQPKSFMRLWNLATAREVRRFGTEDFSISEVAISPDGRRALCDRTYWFNSHSSITLWDTERGLELRQLRHDSQIHCFAFSPDGHYVLTGSGERWVGPNGKLEDARDCVVRLWDVESGREIRRYVGHTTPVMSVSFSPDGQRVLSAGGIRASRERHEEPSLVDCTIRVWDTMTGQEIQRLAAPQPITKVIFSSDGRTILSTCSSHECAFGDGAGKYLRRWDAQTGRELPPVDGRLGEFLPDGRLLTVCDIHTLRVEKLPD